MFLYVIFTPVNAAIFFELVQLLGGTEVLALRKKHEENQEC